MNLNEQVTRKWQRLLAPGTLLRLKLSCGPVSASPPASWGPFSGLRRRLHGGALVMVVHCTVTVWSGPWYQLELTVIDTRGLNTISLEASNFHDRWEIVDLVSPKT